MRKNYSYYDLVIRTTSCYNTNEVMTMHSNPAEIGERIKSARKAAHLSQTELAQRLDKTMRTVQKYESGEIEPSIAMINAIAKILNISPADLIGYQKPEIQLDSLSDVIAVLYQLNKKAGIRFEIDVQRPPHSEEWSCSLKFKGNDHSAEMNDSLCLILEEFRDEREKLETYWTDQESFDRWIEKELAYYADAKLQDKEVEVLSDLERIQRRNELDRQMLEKMKKAAEEKRIAEEIAEAKVLKEKLEKSTIDIGVKCGDGKMYGSVTTADIADGLKKLGLDVDKKKVVLKENIKSLGVFDIEIKVYAGISAKVRVNIVKAND